MSHKPLLFHGCLISIGTIIALVIVEFVLRFFPLIQFPVGIPLTSTWLIFLEHPSGSVRLLFDEYGNRSERTYVESQQGSPRVMIIGDSHSFGVGVSQDEMYSSLLERKLQESTEAPAARVLNISRMGTSLLQYARFFHEFEDFDPDTIILGIYSGNDLLDYWIDKQREVTVE
ncbi:MAG: hypothetical protein KDD55_09790, partial [Bdellovibrionales bacterium]|nr:hypothetical protein [Bdellovibrionales bacterium]